MQQTTFESEQVKDISFVEQLCWKMLSDAVHDRKHPMRTVVIGTAKENMANLRTVVLRGADPVTRTICFHTDIRSTKIDEIRSTGQLSWLTYDPLHRSQIRLSGPTIVHHGDELAQNQWAKTQHSSRRCYLLPQGPGLPLEPDTQDDRLSNFGYSMEESESGFVHFAVIETFVENMEWYYTHHRGNRRAKFVYKENILVDAQWLTP